MPIIAEPNRLSAKLRSVPCSRCGKPAFVKKGKGNALKLCSQHRAEHETAKIRAKKSGVPVQGVQGRVSVSAPPKIEVVQSAPTHAPNREGDRAHKKVAAKNPQNSFAAAVEIITESMSKGEGYRHGWLGNTGAGKTVGIRAFLEATRDAFTLIHDDTKIEAQYNGPVVRALQDAPDDARHVVFRGDVYAGTVVEVEPIADLAMRLSRVTHKPTRIVVDELDRACSLGGKELISPSLRLAMTQGRSMGVSVLWSTQSPQRMPREIVDQSSTIALCQLGPRALNYLDERLCFDREFLEIVPNLEKFQFVIYEQGKRWNGQVYTSPLTSVARVTSPRLLSIP